MRLIAALFSGLVFGLGLILSGMTDPAKVQNFLDVAGTWDPSLAFVMGGAVAVTAVGFGALRRTRAPLFGARFGWTTRSDVDAPLLIGSGLFGVGWGLGGLCPGPALTAVPTGSGGVLLFVVSMLVGFVLARRWRMSRERAPSDGSDERPPIATSRS